MLLFKKYVTRKNSWKLKIQWQKLKSLEKLDIEVKEISKKQEIFLN